MMTVLDWIKFGVPAAVGAIVGGAIAYQVGHWNGDRAGYDRRIAETAVADVKAELERKGDDVKLQSMSDYDLCVAGLHGNGMPVDACEQLRGVQ